MPTKKRSKPQVVTKRKAKGLSGFGTKTAKPLLDTSRIPWFSALPKTGRGA